MAPKSCRCSTTGPSASAGTNVNAPTNNTVPTNNTKNSGVCVGSVPVEGGILRFFASDRASYLTGEILHVHGGGDRMTFGGGRRT